MKKLLAIVLLAITVTIGVLALPQLALAGQHPQNPGQGNNPRTNDDHGQDHGQGFGEGQNEHQVNASFRIRLLGDQQSPPVNTTAFGFASVTLIDNTTLRFSVTVCNIVNVTASHIHVGAAGTNGPVVIPFFSEPTYPFSSPHGCALLEAGVRTPSDLTVRPEAGINNWNDFVHALETNNTYVNVHTTAHPLGEIRGQLVTHPSHAHGNDHNQDTDDAEENDD